MLNGSPIEEPSSVEGQGAPLVIRLGRKRKPAAAGYMIRGTLPLPEEWQGIGISTFGKVIKRGWDWLGITPIAPERVGGLIEVPALAQCLTLNKADFIRAGARGATYLAFRKAIQEAVSRQLAAWGDARDMDGGARQRAIRPVERDLEAVLSRLADRYPLVASLVEQRAGGQRRLPSPTSAPESTDADASAPLFASPSRAPRDGNVATPSSPSAEEVGPRSDDAPMDLPPPSARVSEPGSGGSHRPARYGLSIRFEPRPDDPELARLVESTVWINETHPAYRRATTSRSEGYHVALAVAMALAPLAVESAGEHAFIIAFLASWGTALERRKGKRRQ